MLGGKVHLWMCYELQWAFDAPAGVVKTGNKSAELLCIHLHGKQKKETIHGRNMSDHHEQWKKNSS